MPNLKARLLVVDDDALICRNMSTIFTVLGYATRTAPNGFSALNAIREEIPDIILSDLNMPGMSGLELLSVVRRRFPSIRVIAMSGAFEGTSVPPGVAALVRTCLSEILVGAGYAVRNASDGFSALAAIRDEIPDLILSDLNMPGMSGFELLSVVRRRFPSIRVIAMSSGFPGTDIPHGVAADAFYQKGAYPTLLLRIVEDITRPGQSLVSRRPRLLAPIWVPANGHNASGEMFVTITCPECLRAFPQILDQSAVTALETRCAWCRIPIRCAIVHPAAAA